MNTPFNIFELFTKWIADVPACAIMNALDLECRMLQGDLGSHHLPLMEDALSILRFGQFVRAVKAGGEICSMALPRDHLEFYKNTLVRLIQVNELPTSAANRFDQAFTIAV
jgi:hypothetical protein